MGEVRMEDYEALKEQNERLANERAEFESKTVKLQEQMKYDRSRLRWWWLKLGFLVACVSFAGFGVTVLCRYDDRREREKDAKTQAAFELGEKAKHEPIGCYTPAYYENEQPWGNRYFIIGRGEKYGREVQYDQTRFASTEDVLKFMAAHNLKPCGVK